MPIDNNRRPRSALKTYFAKNAIPTEAQFAELIDGGINQRDDGVYKASGDPLSIEAAGDEAGMKRAVAFYGAFADQNPAWTIALKARRAPADPASARTGWSVIDSGSVARLTIDAGTGNVGVGTIQPREKLEVDGRLRAGGLNVGTWALDGNLAGAWNAALEPAKWENYALLQRTDGVTFLNSAATLYLRTRNGDRLVVDDKLVTVAGSLRVGGALTPSAGKDASTGIAFPENPGQGGGDGAWLRYYARAGESTTLDIGTSNDEDDHIALMPGMRNGVPLANVGIGTYEPREKLDVAGRVRAGPIVMGEWAPDKVFGFVGAFALDQSKPANYALRQSGDGPYKGWTCLNSPATVSVRINDADRLLVEDRLVTAAVPVLAKDALTVQGALIPSAGNEERNGISFPWDPGGGSGDRAWIRYYSRDPKNADTSIREQMTLEIGIANDTNDHLLLTTSGNVGIGTLAPVRKLDVNGEVAVRGKQAISGGEGADGWLRLNQDGNFPSGVHTPGKFAPGSINVCPREGPWDFNPGPGNIAYAGTLNKLDVQAQHRAYIRCNDLCIGGAGRRPEPGLAMVDEWPGQLVINYTKHWPKTVVHGEIFADNIRQNSSKELKRDIKPISSARAASIVHGLEPVSFAWKADGEDAPEQLGFIAQHSPAEVTTPERDAIALPPIIAALTRVVRDQATTIAALTDRLGRLEARA